MILVLMFVLVVLVFDDFAAKQAGKEPDEQERDEERSRERLFESVQPTCGGRSKGRQRPTRRMLLMRPNSPGERSAVRMREPSDSGCHSAGKSSSPAAGGRACSPARSGSCSSSSRVRGALIAYYWTRREKRVDDDRMLSKSPQPARRGGATRRGGMYPFSLLLSRLHLEGL